ncbi:MAG: hypothetical protein D6768_07215 [Chloroflexi bacterium]|nr:MAG: hypothetical protein D6768_07215 [Chloroflexota bacterium]
MQSNPIRTLTGLFFGGFGGISFAAAILPIVIGSLFPYDSISMMLSVRGYVLPMAVVWAIAGAITGWHGGTRFGGAVLGGVGIVSGLVLGIFALEGSLPEILVSMLTGLVYGGIAGLIIGRAFLRHAQEAS